jgi:hypothetical protein
MRFATFVIALPTIALWSAPVSRPHQHTPRYTRLYALKPREGVFAYARIAPDGKRLVYASEVNSRRPNGPRGYTETVVDLATGNILFSEPGIDAYWSLDGKRLIYSAQDGVAIVHADKFDMTHNAAPNGLGDYYSWAKRDGKDLILTIVGKYYYLDGDKAVMPAQSVKVCGTQTGDRPLISKDGTHLTTFVNGNVMVRSLDNCDDMFDTGIKGGKADFSWDGKYIAFHSPRSDGSGYDIKIVDIAKRSIRTLPGLNGSALFPSWTEDGRLCFRYDGPDYRGFMMANDVLEAPAEPLPSPQPLPESRTWNDIFPETHTPARGVQMVMIWAPWSAHSEIAFGDLERARKYFATSMPGMTVREAADPSSKEADITRQLTAFGVTMPRIPLSERGLELTEARNQMPTTLLFRDGQLIDKKLGAQTFEELRAWVSTRARSH